KTVTGTVTSADKKEPIYGATVAVKGTNIATFTNDKGVFSIQVPNDKSTLVISFVGFDVVEVSTAGKTTLDLSLATKSSTLTDVVVTGYTAQQKKDITGSVAVVNVANLKQVPSGTTEALLQGQAAGVTVINSGMPGGGSTVRIRGITTVGSNDPLVIIDGVQGSLHDLNVNDIESIQVLKDAGAAAIYGVRGSNGVIVVTTKRGKQGKARVSYDMYVGRQQPLKDGFNLANTTETANAVQQSYINSGITPNNKQYGTGTTPIIPDYITPTAGLNGGLNTDPSTYHIYNNPITRANKTGTDWFHEIFKPVTVQSHNIAVSSGSERSNFYLSVGYLDQPGTLIETFLKRYTARINTQFNIANKIRIGENAYVFYKQNPGITNQNEGNAISHSYRENPIIPVYDIMGNYAGTGSQNLGNAQNPVANMRRTHNNRNNDWQVIGNIFAEFDFLKHFTARTSIGGTFDNYYYYFFNYTAYENAENRQNPNAYTEGSGYNANRIWTNTIQYQQVFGDHNVKALVGYEAINNGGRSMTATRNNYFITNPGNLTVDPNLWTVNFGDPTTQTNSGAPYRGSLLSFFGRVDYIYQDKYILAGTLRRDGSSVFHKKNQWGTFPSITAGWRISREKFMDGVDWLNDLKLRAGWGKLGNNGGVPATNAYSLYGQSAANSFYDLNGANNSALFGVYASQLGNEATTWEEDIVTNIGLDASVANNKLEFSIEWYKKAISGLLFRPTVSVTGLGAVTAPFINAGNIENTGVDASVTYHGTVSRDLKFDATLNFTSYNNKVKGLPPGILYYDRGSAGSGRIGVFTRLEPGQAVGAFYGYEAIGLFKDAADVTASATQEAAAPGRLKFRDINGDKKIDVNDRFYFGNPNPDFTAGLNLGVTYKSFDVSTFFYASVGNDVINYVRYWTDFPQVFDGAVSKDAVYNSWTPTNTNAKVPRLERGANFSTTTQFNSYYMEDGSFLRCKSLMVGYTLPTSLINRVGIDRVRVYVQAVNLFTITKYTGLDPELQSSDLGNNSNFGIDFGNYPSNQRMFTFGINLGF
ncbi:MAG TPA: TonB-dependent receptor, partial [Chitinophagaceae bacterium]|nr:TonB-dependent receptor [Chitinophagaceae bacterium]